MHIYKAFNDKPLQNYNALIQSIRQTQAIKSRKKDKQTAKWIKREVYKELTT